MPAGPFRILIVDDSPEDRELYRRYLLQDPEHDYVFHEAESGAEALRCCETARPDCLLVDYRLPDLDGVTMLSELAKQQGPLHAPVIMLTGQGSEAVAVEAMKRGAQDYLLKHLLTPDALQRSVHHAIEKVGLLRSIEHRTEELSRANAELQNEVAQRKRAEAALQQMYDELEALVASRTEELSRANRELSVEVAERRRMEEERAQLLAREQHANRLKDEFLATVSHELRTPLNAVLGWARVLRSAATTPALQARALESIERNAQAQARLIEDLLEVSRIMTGKLRLKIRALDLIAVVDEAIDVTRPAADAKDIRMIRELPPGSWPAVGDPDRLQQVAWNLLSNAVKFTPRGGTIRVALERSDGWDQLSVSDTGRGIDPAFLPHVFAPFRQADASTTREHGGLGLGLAIVRQLVEMHGGTVHVASEISRGSKFTVRLPVHAGSAPPPRTGRARDHRPESGPDLTGVRVMLVDDDADARELVTASLGFWGAEVTAVASAADGLALLGQVRPDVLLSDIAMREEDGYVFLQRVRALPPDAGGTVPAIALTAYAGETDRARALQAGFQFHVAKPVDPLELARVVHRLVESGAHRGV